MSTLSTHVLDTSIGRPAAGVAVTVERRESGTWLRVARARTDADGRCQNLLPEGVVLQQASYRLNFDSGSYFGTLGIACFYPYVSIVFDVRDEQQHHHVPLLISPFGYSTYRGSQGAD